MSHARDLPDAGEGMCCMGAAVYGPGRCTCWTPIYSTDQAALQDGPSIARSTMCGDCAYRQGSPERQGNDTYAGSGDGELEDMAVQGVFYCHTGMRRIVAWVHPAGVRVDVDGDDYDPPRGLGKAWQADGTPAEVCAGYLATRRRLLGGP